MFTHDTMIYLDLNVVLEQFLVNIASFCLCYIIVNNTLSIARWTKRSPLSVPRCHANLVVANDQLFLIGGRARHVQVPSLGSIHVYREESDTWDYVTEMKVPRHDAGCVVAGK